LPSRDHPAPRAIRAIKAKKVIVATKAPRATKARRVSKALKATQASPVAMANAVSPDIRELKGRKGIRGMRENPALKAPPVATV
jgi:hypothetical protein